MERKYNLPFPPSVLKNIKPEQSNEERLQYWIDVALRNNGEPDLNNLEDKKWTDRYSKIVREKDQKRSAALHAISVKRFAKAHQVDFSWMNFSKKEIIGRVNAATSATLVTLKNCQLNDGDLKKMDFSKKLELLILSFNPITDASLPLWKSIGERVKSICLAHTLISKDAVTCWRKENPKLEIFYD